MAMIVEILLKLSLVFGVVLGVYYANAGLSARWRYWLVTGGLLTGLLLPLSLPFLPRWEIEAWPADFSTPDVSPESHPGVPTEATFPAKAEIDCVAEAGRVAPGSTAIVPGPEVPREVASISAPAASTTNGSRSWSYWIAIPWLLGFAIATVRSLWRSVRLRRWARQSRPVPPGTPIAVQTERLARRLALQRRVRLRYSADTATPLTWGVWRPLLLLPADYREWDEATREAVLLHELIHIKRWDYGWQRLAEWIGTAYWFHPLYHWLLRLQRLERERACDEGVLSCGVPAPFYAELLLRFARSHRQLALGMASAGPLQQRIAGILSLDRLARSSRRERLRRLAILPGFVLCLGIALAYPASVPALGRDSDAPTRNTVPETAESRQSAVPEKVLLLPVDNDSTSGEVPPSAVVARAVATLPNPRPELLRRTEAGELALPAPVVTSRSRTAPRRYYTWTEGRKTYRLWLGGEVEVYDFLPHFNPLSVTDFLVLEIGRPRWSGRETRTLVRTRAPFEGALVQTYVEGTVNGYSGFANGALVTGYYRNDEWVPLGQGIALDLQAELAVASAWLRAGGNPVAQPPHTGEVPARGEQVWQKLLDRYLAEADLPRRPQRTPDSPRQVVGRMAQLQYRMMNAAPYATSPAAPVAWPLAGKQSRLGQSAVTKTTTGWSGELGTNRSFRVYWPAPEQPARLDDFNFHLRFNLFRQAELRLQFYALTDSGVFLLGPPEGIPVEIDGRTGWHGIDLKKYEMTTAHAVLVELSVVDARARRDGGGIFFSHYPRLDRDDQPEEGLAAYPLAWYGNVTY